MQLMTWIKQCVHTIGVKCNTTFALHFQSFMDNDIFTSFLLHFLHYFFNNKIKETKFSIYAVFSQTNIDVKVSSEKE